MAKRNYGTVQRQIEKLVDDLTSKDFGGGLHNMVNPRELVPLLDAIFARLPRQNSEFMLDVITKLMGRVTMGMVHDWEKTDPKLHDAFIAFIKASDERKKRMSGESNGEKK